VDLLWNFVNIRRQPDKDLEVFFTQIEVAHAELEESGLKANPAYHLLAILNGLPPEYDAVRTIIQAADDIDVDRAKRLIRQHNGVLNMCEQTTAINAVSQARDRTRRGKNADQRSRGPDDDRRQKGRRQDRRNRHDCRGQHDRRDQHKDDKDDVVCYYCHKPGHIRPDCPKLHKSKQEESRANAAAEESSSEDETVLSITDQANALSDETDCWYLDSGATWHVTCCRDLLHDFVERRDKSHGLLLGNNH
jgi:hypothetical protein